jgi:hypothetical protein
MDRRRPEEVGADLIREGHVIKDPTVLHNLTNSWQDVRNKQNFIKRHLAGSMFGIGSLPPIHLADPLYNLLLIYAYAVLNDILSQLRDEDNFRCSSSLLGRLMEASKSKIVWVNYNLVNSGRRRRNDIAHRSITVPRGECWEYIDAIEVELSSWGIINS